MHSSCHFSSAKVRTGLQAAAGRTVSPVWFTSPPEQQHSSSPPAFIGRCMFTAQPLDSISRPITWSIKAQHNLHIDLNFPRWISTRSSLPSGASADTRRFCTYGSVYQMSSSPSTWWWVSSPEPRRPSTAGTARAQEPGISPPSPGRSARTGAPPRTPPASPLASCCRTTGPSASRVARDGCTARRPSRAQ